MSPGSWIDLTPGDVRCLHEAQRQTLDETKLVAALHATWMQAAVNRGAGAMFGGKAEWLTVWDLVPELEPGFHRRQREERRERANLERWKAVARQMGWTETKH